MGKESEVLQFLEAKGDTVENLEAIKLNLTRCVSQGMIDSNDDYYNQLLILIDEATLSENWNELEEVVSRAKILEIDVAAWLSGHGQTSISLPWPRAPKS